MLFNTLIFGGMFVIFPAVFWRMFNLASCPYPLLALVLFTYGFYNGFATLLWKFHIQGMALEVYHLPPQVRQFTACVFIPNLRKQLTDEALRPLAMQRAAKLRQLMGVDVEENPRFRADEAPNQLLALGGLAC